MHKEWKSVSCRLSTAADSIACERGLRPRAASKPLSDVLVSVESSCDARWRWSFHVGVNPPMAIETASRITRQCASPACVHRPCVWIATVRARLHRYLYVRMCMYIYAFVYSCKSICTHTYIKDPSKLYTGVLALWPYVGQQSHTRHHSCVTNASRIYGGTSLVL